MKLKYTAPASKQQAHSYWKSVFENRTLKDFHELQAKSEPLLARSDNATGEIVLMDEIGFWGVTSKSFNDALAKLENVSDLTVRINSPGGDVFEALAIHNALRNFKGNVTTVVEGLAASAATIVMMAGAKVQMYDNAMMMVHRAWTIALGNAAEMRDTAGTLEKVDSQIANIYAGQTGKTMEQMLNAMKGEVDGTWYTADEAKAEGLITDIVSAAKEQAMEAAAEERFTAMRRRLQLALAEV